MIENEKDLDCQMKHKQPISMVVLDPQLNSNQRLLCYKCIEDFETQAGTIGFKRVIQMIEDKRKISLEIVGNVITQNIKNIELFQSQLFNLKSFLVQQLDQMINNTKDWISNLQSINQKFSQYSFFQELDLIIKNQQSTQNDQINFSNQIKNLNDVWNTKLFLKLEIFKSFQEYSKCKDLLNNLTQYTHQQQQIISNKINNQDKEQNNQIKNRIIIYQQQQNSNKLQYIYNSIGPGDMCYAIAFDATGKIMISTSGKDIKVWNFNNGIIQQTHLLKEHQNTVSCLICSQTNNYFVSGSDDNSVRIWKYQNNNQWQSSKPYNQHKGWIYCMILTQKEDQLISCSEDKSIKVWMVDFKNNELKFLYSLDKHAGVVRSLSLNPSERVLVSCGLEDQIIIWKKGANSQWKFQYVVNQSIKDYGNHVKFLQEDQFIWLPYMSNCLCVFEFQNGLYRENIQKRVQFKKVNRCYLNEWGFPIIYNKDKNLICLRHDECICILKGQDNGLFSIVEELDCKLSLTFGTITNNGQYLIHWHSSKMTFEIYEILYKQ